VYSITSVIGEYANVKVKTKAGRLKRLFCTTASSITLLIIAVSCAFRAVSLSLGF